MGGYIAAAIGCKLSVPKLVLFCPALYAAEAGDCPFDERFTQILRQPGSFRNSPVLDALADYRGEVLLVIGDQDAVIPNEVIDLYERALANAARMTIARIPNAPHKLHVWAAENPANGAVIITTVRAFIAG
jgi:pimeloyl-ACP methyl ester carboxylesterase